jgi:hypothetical protein
MDTWAARLIDDLHPYRTVPNDGLGLGQRVGYGVNSHDAIAIAHAFQTKRIADALEKLADHTTRASAQPVDETERLREALREIADGQMVIEGSGKIRFRSPVEIARAALQHKGEVSRG